MASSANNGFLLTDYKITAHITDACSLTTLEQRYTNNLANAVEAFYKIPLPPYAAVNSMEIEYDGRVLHGQINEKEEAENKYNDAMASGRGAFLAQKLANGFFKVSLGNIMPKKDVVIRVTIISQICTVIDSLHYCLHRYMFPLNRFNLTVNITLDMSTPITDILIDCPHQLTYQDNAHHKALVTISQVGVTNNILAIVTTANASMPSCYIEHNGADQTYAATLSYYPQLGHFSFETMAQKSEVVFLVDCSGSMKGNSIQSAKRALEVLMRSLNESIKFNIYLFGSRYVKLYKQSTPYNDKSLSEASTWIDDKVHATFGGTNMCEPLTEIMEYPYNPEYPRQVFVLTDGQVCDREKILNMMSKQSSSTRVFALGIGRGVDRNLVIGLSQVCKGYYSFIADRDPNMEAKLLPLLQIALEPMLSNITVDWGTGIKVTQAPSIIRPVFMSERMIVHALIHTVDDPTKEHTVLVNGTDPSGNVFSYPVKLDFSQAVLGDDSDLIHSVTANLIIADLEQLEEKKAQDHKATIVRLGKRYGLVSKHTAFFVDCDNDQPILDNPVTADILGGVPSYGGNIPNSISLSVDSAQYKGGGACCGGGGGGGYSSSNYPQKDETPISQSDVMANKKVMDILRLQQANGSWKSSCRFEFAVARPGQDIVNADIWTTIYVIAYLQKYCAATETSWSLAVAKSIKWIKSQLDGNESITYESLLELARPMVVSSNLHDANMYRTYIKMPKKNIKNNKINDSNINRFNSMISMFETENGADNEVDDVSTTTVTSTSTATTETTSTSILSDPNLYKDKKRLKEQQEDVGDEQTQRAEKKKKRLPPPPADLPVSTGNGNNNTNNNSNSDEIKKLKDELEMLREEFESREAEIKLQEKDLRKKMKDLKEQKKEAKDALEKVAPRSFSKTATKSIAIPANILDDVTSDEMTTYLVEMISRVSTLFAVDEVIVYRSAVSNSRSDRLMKLLEYIETPRNIRHHLFDLRDEDYQHVDKLKKMEAAHHNTNLRWTRFREGIVSHKSEQGASLVDVGLGPGKEVVADKLIKTGVRVTLEMEEDKGAAKGAGALKKGKLVSPQDVKAAGHYWGYQIRRVDTLDEADETCPYESGYDCRVMLSNEASDATPVESVNFKGTDQFQHILIIFGEKESTLSKPADYIINPLGSEIISRRPRFEESLTISLSMLVNKLYSV
ncbi:hypothetical protein SAMD00019534_033050 [Acytostelium subglobosum LB1]|uniref:hypothetical protein n=1 Tax=Acytostelium subglobosum LB1 TaxID=1410327 RepID=UPI000644C0AB|nr:hypothetical protein SAMD00019534_033050 [Acytostelium subglobosum LB1]GAM20130.1 hypothetical protein SAMD00019534_033050 [Acytostelium subglobosum LB1]|eukprot:XP_012756892.1 hypothetical protein SAMD00019534_033050 [Acytostelium subglobosum LB1]